MNGEIDLPMLMKKNITPTTSRRRQTTWWRWWTDSNWPGLSRWARATNMAATLPFLPFPKVTTTQDLVVLSNSPPRSFVDQYKPTNGQSRFFSVFFLSRNRFKKKKTKKNRKKIASPRSSKRWLSLPIFAWTKLLGKVHKSTKITDKLVGEMGGVKEEGLVAYPNFSIFIAGRQRWFFSLSVCNVVNA